jgi:membrane associated rhomboid family serine protease
MTAKRSGPAQDLFTVVGWLAVLWAIFIVDVVLRVRRDYFLADDFGLRPRDPDHAWGILTAHLLHANAAHIIANSLGLLILGWLSCRYSRSLTYIAMFVAALTAGTLTWLIGSWHDPRPVVHVGASGVIFGLIGFLLANAIVRFDWRAILIGLLVGWLFLDTLPGMLPSGTHGQPISWEMHMGGFIGGVLTSLVTRNRKPT